VVYEELLVSGSIEDLVVGGTRVVNEELLGSGLDDRLLLQLDCSSNESVSFREIVPPTETINYLVAR